MIYHYAAPSLPFARTMEAPGFNAIANHPAVRPWLGGDEPMDLTGTLAHPDNVAGLAPGGGFICVALGDGRYDVHSLFLPDREPQEAITTMRAALDYFFASTDGVTLVTKVPKGNRAALGLAKLAGFTLAWTGTVQWTATETRELDCYELGLDKWAARSQAALAAGTWLHDAMDETKTANGSALADHSAEDAIHLQMAGAALLMVLAGNALKGVQLYNRWATVSAYPFIRLVRAHPAIIDLDGILVECRGEVLEVLSCR